MYVLKMSFHDWLMKNTYRCNPVGDLAREAETDEVFPVKVRSPKKLREYLTIRHACDGALQAANEAWEEYELYVGGDSAIDRKTWVCGIGPAHQADLKAFLSSRKKKRA